MERNHAGKLNLLCALGSKVICGDRCGLKRTNICNNRQEWAKAACNTKSKDGWATLKEGSGDAFEAVIMEEQSKVDKNYRENRAFQCKKVSEVTKNLPS